MLGWAEHEKKFYNLLARRSSPTHDILSVMRNNETKPQETKR